MNNILMEDEVNKILSMNKYWEKVAKRDDKSPLFNEVYILNNMLKFRVLPIVAEYAKKQKELMDENNR